mgnify:CR=1 FL=1
MKKKTSIYPSADQCLLDKNIIYQHFNGEFNRIVDKFNDFNQDFTVKLNSEGDIIGLTRKDYQFFEEFYTISKTIGTKNKARDKKFYDLDLNEIGATEWDVISFCSNFDGTENSRLKFIYGNVGEGKSTLINYVLKYLYNKRSSLKTSFLPILINCHGFLSRIKSEKEKGKTTDEFIDKLIKEKVLDKFRKEISVDNEDFWKWYEQNIESPYRRKINNIRKIHYKQEEETHEIYKLRFDEENVNLDFFLHVLSYVINDLKKEVVVVFDNIDPFDIETIKEFYWKAKNYINLSPIRIIVTLREDTLRKLQDSIKDIAYLKTIAIQTNLVDILKRRCKKLLENIETANQTKPLLFNHDGITYNNFINPIQHVSVIIDSILSDYSLNYITLFSKKNIRNELELLRIIFESGFIPNSVLNKSLYSSKEHPIVIPPEFILSSIITFGYGTYFTKKSREFKIPGVINILSNSNHDNPIQILTKLYILEFLNGKGQQSQQKRTELVNTFSVCVEKMNDKNELLSSFNYCLYRLFNTGLITSPDMHSVSSQDEFEKYIIDIRISTLGEFYYETLLSSPFYLFYVKDDVYLSDINMFDDAYTVLKNNNKNRYFWLNFKNLITFLNEYGNLEIAALSKFIEFESFNLFEHSFCCKKSKLFSIMILDELIKFCNSKDLHSKMLITFFDNYQVLNSSDITELESTKKDLYTKYTNLLKK